jgi:hypothetical protein
VLCSDPYFVPEFEINQTAVFISLYYILFLSLLYIALGKLL